MYVISQGDRGKPGPVGPPGELGEKVRGRGSCRCILCVQVLLFMVIYVCFFLKQGSQGPLGPRGQPGDAVSVYKNTP